MKDSQNKKRLAMYRKRGAVLKPAPSRDTPSVLSASSAEETDPAQCITEWKQDRFPATDLSVKITEILINSPNPETVLPRIAEALGESFQVQYCAIIIMASDRLAENSRVGLTQPDVRRNAINKVYWYTKNADSLLTQYPSYIWENLDLATILASSDPLDILDVGTTQSDLPPVDGCEHLPVRALLSIKTRFQGTVNGVIAIMHSKTHHWKASEKERLCAVSDSVAMAISQVQLQKQANASLGHQALLNQLTMAIRNSTELDQILQLAIDGTTQTLQIDRGFILLLKYLDPLMKKNSSHKRLSRGIEATVVCEWVADSSIKEKPNQTFCLSKCKLCQEAFTNAPNPLVIEDGQTIGEEIDGTIAPIFDFHTMPALLLVPLQSQDTVLGFLALQHGQPRTWLSEELEMAELVSAQMSTAIIQFQTLRQTSALVEERTYQLQSILKVQAKLYEKTRQQVDQLRQLNQLKDEFIDTISDQLRNPLASMRMAIRMLRQPGLSPEMQSKYLDILDRQCNREINLIDDILALQELKSKKTPLNFQKIDLKQTIEHLGQSFQEKWASKPLSLEIEFPDFPLLLQSDPDSIDRILQELLTNAGKYSDPDTTVRIGVTRDRDAQTPQIAIAVSNIGSPISPAEQEYIFEQFRRGSGVSEQIIQGTGLGLALVKCLLQHLNGNISVSSQPIDDSPSWLTCFTVTLPQMQG